MGKSFSISLCFLCLFFSSLIVNSESSLAPALYVFGDSLVDSGNNNYLQTGAKVNYTPYGIDFPVGATGRFTNGKTSADFIAEFLGLPFAPPILGLSKDKKGKVLTGINYASGSAGILRETGRANGVNLNMDNQISLFRKTAILDLPSNFTKPANLCDYFSKSIFLVVVGSNDYINNYLQPGTYNSSSLFTPQQFASHLTHKLKKQLTNLYILGARKLVVFEVPPVGCIPSILNQVKPTTTCAENVNEYVILYNTKLRSMLQDLRSTLKFLTIVLGEIYESTYLVNQNPSQYGIIDLNSCCNVGSTTGLCIKDEAPCQNRTKHFYWDSFHPMQEANRNTVVSCFNGSSLCSPINIQQLAQKLW